MSIPYVIESKNDGERVYDLYSRLLKDRIIFLGSALDEITSNSIVAQLLYLESDDPDKDIFIYINSPGGIITGMLAIYDTMNLIKSDVSTVCVGQASSAASFLLAAGTKGKRVALPNSRIMLHQPLGGFEGQVSDIVIHANEIKSVKNKMNKIYSDITGKPVETIEKDLDRDFYMSAYEAVEYGIIDKVEDMR
jgi:ATP-dependent Clp protease protease subunit